VSALAYVGSRPIVLKNTLLKPGEIADSFSLWWRLESMMGQRQVDQAALFYEFSLERHVPATHLLRSIDRFVDLSRFGATWRHSTAALAGPRLIPWSKAETGVRFP
jgi:hypothetical protein